jgi:hypothetical protein
MKTFQVRQSFGKKSFGYVYFYTNQYYTLDDLKKWAIEAHKLDLIKSSCARSPNNILLVTEMQGRRKKRNGVQFKVNINEH